MRHHRHFSDHRIVVVGEEPEWLGRAREAFKPLGVVDTYHAGANAGQILLPSSPTPAVMLFGFTRLDDRAFLACFQRGQTLWPGVPTAVCTSMQSDNLVHLRKVLVSDVIDIDMPWVGVVKKIHDLAAGVDMIGASALLDASPSLKDRVREALRYALRAESTPRTVRGLAGKINMPVSTLRADYRQLAVRSGVSLPDLLHAILLAHVAVKRARGCSLQYACQLVGIDKRTAGSVVRRLCDSDLDSVTSSVARYREWLITVVNRVLVASVPSEP